VNFCQSSISKTSNYAVTHNPLDPLFFMPMKNEGKMITIQKMKVDVN
jgi:hypothetical protein